jgi:hypothetical protein
MIRPSAIDLLRTIETALASMPTATAGQPAERSTLATARALLRHAAIRLEREGQILSDDIRDLHALLPIVATYLLALPDCDEARALAAQIDHTLAIRFRPQEGYASLSSLADEAGALRARIYESLALLQSRRALLRDQPGYIDARARIRAYCAHQIEAEAELIEPAFAGFGPRR